MNNSSHKTGPLCFFLSIALTVSAGAAVKPNPLFTDGAVLQQETPIPIWGTANDGEKVTVKFDGHEVSTTATNGKWRVDLPAHKAGGPFELIIVGDNTLTITNVLVGEVWICAGQSNMEFTLGGAANAKTELPTANYPAIRMFTIAMKIAPAPLAEANSKWVVCSPATAPNFSAVGYFFARDIHKARSVPVGMIHSSVGGTPAQAWTSRDGLEKRPELKFYTDILTNSVATFIKAVEDYQSALEKFHAKYANPTVTGVAWTDLPLSGPISPFTSPYTATSLYNGMIAPLVPYALRGVIWYQGEANNWDQRYSVLFPDMIADWREKWGRGDFPFLYVQVAPWAGLSPQIREQQFLSLGRTTNTAMTVITDVGDAGNPHPNRKEAVGTRLALAARALAYGDKIEYSGPLFASLKIDGNRAVISFTHTGSGLMAKDGDLKGFTITGAYQKFVPAKAEIVGDTVVVSSAEIPVPVAVRYGWDNVPDVNLYNKEGLPASPFRTNDW